MAQTMPSANAPTMGRADQGRRHSEGIEGNDGIEGSEGARALLIDNRLARWSTSGDLSDLSGGTPVACSCFLFGETKRKLPRTPIIQSAYMKSD